MRTSLARTMAKIPARAAIPILLRAASWWKIVEHFCVGPKDKIHEILNVERYIKKGRSYHRRSCMHPACSIQMISPCAGSYIPAVSNASYQGLTPAALHNLLTLFRQVLASAINKVQRGCAKAALTICARSIQRCPR